MKLVRYEVLLELDFLNRKIFCGTLNENNSIWRYIVRNAWDAVESGLSLPYHDWGDILEDSWIGNVK